MTVRRIYLAIMGTVMFGAGVAALIDNQGMTASLGVAAFGVPGEIELRAVYGGLMIGWGVMLLAGLRFPLLAISSLAFTVIGGGCLLLTRFVTALTFGPAGFGGVMTSLILFEVVMVAIAYALLRQALHTEELPDAVQ